MRLQSLKCAAAPQAPHILAALMLLPGVPVGTITVLAPCPSRIPVRLPEHAGAHH